MYYPSFHERYSREIKEVGVIVFILVFFAAYQNVDAVGGIVDKIVDPAVQGISIVYGRFSTLLLHQTGIDLGFTAIPPDPDYVFKVRVATYINQKRAALLLDLATDTRLPILQREEALRGLLKFDSSVEWIQPFLNELPKGGLPGMYDEQAPILDELMKQIRSEGGIRSPLVRAYAEEVFGFMLQLRDSVVRRHSLAWLSDVIAEDAVFLIVPRIDQEKDPAVRAAIGGALWDLRAISEPEHAIQILVPYFKNPAWPELRLPLAAVLTRLGYKGGAADFLRRLSSVESLTDFERVGISVALAHTPYPAELKMTEAAQNLRNQRKQTRELQYALALEKIRKGRTTEQVAYAKPLETRVSRLSAIIKPRKRKKPAALPQLAMKPGREAPATAETNEAPVVSFKDKEHREEIPQSLKTQPGASSQVDTGPAKEEVAELPQEQTISPTSVIPKVVPPTRSEVLPTNKSSNMNLVDMIFEVKKSKVALYMNPGTDSPLGIDLTAGMKGKAEFEVVIGNEHWYQVKSKKYSGWANGADLSMFNLSPGEAASAAPAGPPPSAEEASATYFQPTSDDVAVYEEPSETAKKLDQVLSGDESYRAIQSQKKDQDRWFLLELGGGKKGWVKAAYVELAEKKPSN